MIINRYNKILNNDCIPSINNIKIKNSKNIFNKATNYLVSNKLKAESGNNKFNINLINTSELTEISSLLSSFKSPKKEKKIKKIKLKNSKFNSLLYYLNKNTKFKENEIQNRYRPIIKEFFGKKDYIKFANKSEKFIRPKEVKTLYKDIKLIKTIFDYINNSFLKIRYNQAKINHEKMIELFEKQKKEKFKNQKEKNIILVDKCLQIKNLIYKKNINELVDIESEKIRKENKIIYTTPKEDYDKNLALRNKLKFKDFINNNL
jgi:hypothetical protein